ncbi:Uncharacterized protein SCF082_LOCUS26913, partial [Durusdinium trenchii]
ADVVRNDVNWTTDRLVLCVCVFEIGVGRAHSFDDRGSDPGNPDVNGRLVGHGSSGAAVDGRAPQLAQLQQQQQQQVQETQAFEKQTDEEVLRIHGSVTEHGMPLKRESDESLRRNSLNTGSDVSLNEHTRVVIEEGGLSDNAGSMDDDAYDDIPEEASAMLPHPYHAFDDEEEDLRDPICVTLHRHRCMICGFLTLVLALASVLGFLSWFRSVDIGIDDNELVFDPVFSIMNGTQHFKLKNPNLLSLQLTGLSTTVFYLSHYNHRWYEFDDTGKFTDLNLHVPHQSTALWILRFEAPLT